MNDKTKVVANKNFYWDGKNIKAGDTVEMSEADARWMLHRKAVSPPDPKAKADSNDQAGAKTGKKKPG